MLYVPNKWLQLLVLFGSTRTMYQLLFSMGDEFGFGNSASKRHVTCSALTQLQKLKFFTFYETGLLT